MSTALYLAFGLGHVHFWLWRLCLPLALLVFLYAIGSEIAARIKNWRNGATKPNSNTLSEAGTEIPSAISPKPPKTGNNRKIASAFLITAGMVGAYLIGEHHGYQRRSVEMASNIYSLNDVDVLRRDSDNRYLLRTAWGQPFEMVFCSDYLPEFEIGSTLRILVYEDRHSCKSVADKQLGFIVARNSDGQPIIRGE